MGVAGYPAEGVAEKPKALERGWETSPLFIDKEPLLDYHFYMDTFILFWQNILAEFQGQMIDVLGEAWIANVISLIMGILGTIAFFMQIPKKVKPIVIQYGDIIFKVEEKNAHGRHWVTLKGIELFLSISNLKNAVGIMEDMFVRIYTTDSYNPETVIYYITKRTIDGNEDNFTPFVLNPNSHISMKATFGQVEQSRSEKNISLDKNYAVDLYCKLIGIKKPFSIKSIITYNNSEIVNNELVLKNLNMNIERDKYSKELGNIYRATYKGIINFHFTNLFHDVKYYTYYIPKRYFIGIFESLFFLLTYAVSNSIAFFVNKRIIINEGKIIRSPRIRFGNSEHRLLMEKTMVVISKQIEKMLETINNGLKDEDKISLSTQGNNFTLTRFGKELKIYAPGDSAIYAQILENENTINIRYEIKESQWKIKYWSHNNRFITPYNMAINILNYFVLHTIVRR